MEELINSLIMEGCPKFIFTDEIRRHPEQVTFTINSVENKGLEKEIPLKCKIPFLPQKCPK